MMRLVMDARKERGKMFLSPETMADLTGYERHADQRKWLSSHGWTFEVSKAGRPVVSRAHAEMMLNPSTASSKAWKPNIAAIRKAA